MNLTKDQGRLLEEGTPAQRKAMEILLALGEIGGAESLVPITSAHVSGASYKLIGGAGVEFIDDFAGGTRVAVPTTVNPLGTDLAQWRELGIPEAFAEKQARIARAYEAMGTRTIFSCTPYEHGVRPGLGEHVAWAESNATCFANSVLGARTNREGGPSAPAAAIVGATPDFGLHRDEGRQPTILVGVPRRRRRGPLRDRVRPARPLPRRAGGGRPPVRPRVPCLGGGPQVVRRGPCLRRELRDVPP